MWLKFNFNYLKWKERLAYKWGTLDRGPLLLESLKLPMMASSFSVISNESNHRPGLASHADSKSTFKCRKMRAKFQDQASTDHPLNSKIESFNNHVLKWENPQLWMNVSTRLLVHPESCSHTYSIRLSDMHLTSLWKRCPPKTQRHFYTNVSLGNGKEVDPLCQLLWP